MSAALSLLSPPLDATRPLSRRTAPRADFEEDFVDRLSLGYGAVDYFGVHVIIDDDALRGAGLFFGAEYTE